MNNNDTLVFQELYCLLRTFFWFFDLWCVVSKCYSEFYTVNIKIFWAYLNLSILNLICITKSCNKLFQYIFVGITSRHLVALIRNSICWGSMLKILFEVYAIYTLITKRCFLGTHWFNILNNTPIWPNWQYRLWLYLQFLVILLYIFLVIVSSTA